MFPATQARDTHTIPTGPSSVEAENGYLQDAGVLRG